MTASSYVRDLDPESHKVPQDRLITIILLMFAWLAVWFKLLIYTILAPIHSRRWHYTNLDTLDDHCLRDWS
jgi:hypothetical protein